MKKLKSKVLKLLSILLVLTLVLVPFTANIDAAISTKTSSLPIYCYSRYAGSNITVYTKTSTSSKKQGIIIPSDYIKIVALNTSGWAKVTYPTKQGYKTGYCLSKGLFENIKFSDKFGNLKGATQNTYPVYKKYNLKSRLGTISGDTRVKITGIHKDGNTQILYKSSGKYYLGWLKGKWSITSTKTNEFLSFQKEVVRLVNVERAKVGLKELSFNAELSNVTTLKSQDMINKNYFSHTSPTYGSPFDMMKKFNISYRAAGENIAKGQKTPAEVVTAWMNSKGHRENILNSKYTEIGVGVAKDSKGTLYWTQMFIGK